VAACAWYRPPLNVHNRFNCCLSCGPLLQLSDLEEGPYLLQLEELLLGGNLGLVPARLPASLLHRARLRRLSIPSWWRPAGAEGMAGALLHLMPWLALEES
jgi:hypothetical protein